MFISLLDASNNCVDLGIHIIDDNNLSIDFANVTLSSNDTYNLQLISNIGSGPFASSDNNFTTAEKTKLAGIAESADVNVIESVKVNGTALTVTEKAVNIDLSGKADASDIPVNSDFTLAGLSEKSYNSLTDKPSIPTKISDLTNDSNFVEKDGSKVLSTNDYTTAEKTKLAGVESGANVNIIESVKVNDTALTITDKSVNIDLSGKANTSDIPTNNSFTLAGLSEKSYNSLTNKPSIPTKISDLTNDSNFVVKDGSKVLSTNDYTTTEKTKLAGIAESADVNVIESVKVNGTALTITDKAVNIDLSEKANTSDIPTNSSFTLAGLSEKSYNSLTDKPSIPTNGSFTLAGLSEKSYNSLTDKPTIPTKTSDLTNDSNFITKSDLKDLIISESNYDLIHSYIQSGDAANIFSIGDVFTTEHSTYGTIQWQIAAFDQATLVDTSIQHSITLVSVGILTKLPFDDAENSGAPNDRSNRGYSKWSQSNVRQWLNSSGSANNWFIPQNDYDTCSYSDIDGFMKGFTDSKFISYLAVSTNTTALNDDWDKGETTNDKFFLPSYTEIFGSNNKNMAEGVYWSTLFSTGASRIKYYNSSASSWWLRSPDLGLDDGVALVVESGGSINTYIVGYDDLGLAPACVIY